VVKACFLSASDANCLPARCFKRGPNRQKSLIQILPTRVVTSYGSVLGRLRTILPTYPHAHPMTSISWDTIRNTWLAISLQQMLTFCYTHGNVCINTRVQSSASEYLRSYLLKFLSIYQSAISVRQFTGTHFCKWWM
jgi:hypothetical protein